MKFEVIACRPMKATIGGGEGKAFMKLIVASDSDKVVGVHMIGPDCAEIMQVSLAKHGDTPVQPIAACDVTTAPSTGCSGQPLLIWEFMLWKCLQLVRL